MLVRSNRLVTFIATLFAVLVGVLTLQIGGAWAATFEVSPTRLRLTADATSGLLTVKNQTKEPLRFQAFAYAWSESKDGKMQLAKTDEIVFFPSMFTIAAGESRKVRVGTLGGFSSTERSFRIFIEELPPLGKSTSSNAVKILTRMAIPVFLAPAAESRASKLDNLALSAGVMTFGVKNTGNIHFVVKSVKVVAYNAKGQVLFEKTVPGWYVLAASERDYAFAIPAAKCALADRVAIEVVTDDAKLQASLQASGAQCGPP